MSWPSVYAWQDELSAAEFQAALDAAKQDAERVSKEFAESLPPGSPAYDAQSASARSISRGGGSRSR